MNKSYKVWVEIEEIGEDGEPTGNDIGILPDSLGTFDLIESAVEQVKEVVGVFGVDPENSDSVKGIHATDCRLCEDNDCPYSGHYQGTICTGEG